MLYNLLMSIKKVLASIRKADEMFSLIEDGDKIGVGLSGGKDSSLLLYAMYLYKFLYQNTYHKSFEIVGIHIDLNFGEEDFSTLLDYFKQYPIEIEVEKSKSMGLISDEEYEAKRTELMSRI